MFADEIRRAAEAAPRHKLEDVNRLLWASLGAGSVTEAEAEALSVFIGARMAPSPSPAPLRRRGGSRPRSDESMARRRRWAASGRLPPQLASKFTLSEQAALAVITLEASKRGDCRLALGQIAAMAGIGETSARNAIRRARVLGLLTVKERRVSRFRNDTNVVAIISREWLAWMSLPRADAPPHTGCKIAKGTNTRSKGRPVPGRLKRLQGAFGIETGRPVRAHDRR